MNNDGKIDLIKERVDIVTVVERYVKLKQSGKNFSGLCPFHSEKTPSFNVSPDIQIFKCFGCGKSGDIFTFIQEIEKIEFREALEKLAKEAGIELDKKEGNDPYKLYYDLNYLASEIYIRLLKSDKKALEYVKGRGFTDSDIETFRIGFAPNTNIVLKKVKERFKLTKKQLLDCGLFIEKNDQLRDKYINRIVFPITSPAGKIIGFTGRVLPGNDYGPKYINSPETPVFHKSKNVYGLHQSKAHIRKEDLCIICEGTTDVISAHRVGLKNIVAPLGTSITLDQLKLVSQFTQNILFIFDSDFAGQKALERAFILSEKIGLNTYAINTSPHKDIDDMIQKDANELKSRVKKNKVDTFTYLIGKFIESTNLTRLENQIKLKAYIKSLLREVTDREKYNFYMERAELLSSSTSNYEKDSMNIMPTIQTQIQNKKQSGINFEELYLKILLEDDTISIRKDHELAYFIDPQVVTILEAIPEDSKIDIKQLHKKLDNTAQSFIETLLLSKSFEVTEDLDKIYQRIKGVYLQAQHVDLRAKLAAAEKMQDNAKAESILNEIRELMNKIKSSRL